MGSKLGAIVLIVQFFIGGVFGDFVEEIEG
jgi:hypothetical protein